MTTEPIELSTWSLVATNAKTGHRTTIAEGDHETINAAFLRLVMHRDRLEIIAPNGDLDAATMGPIAAANSTASEPNADAATLGVTLTRIDVLARRINDLQHELDRLDRLRMLYEDRTVQRLAALEANTANSEATDEHREDLRDRIDSLTVRANNHAETIARRLAELEQRAAANAETIKRNHAETVSFASECGDKVRGLTACQGDLRRDLEKLAKFAEDGFELDADAIKGIASTISAYMAGRLAEIAAKP